MKTQCYCVPEFGKLTFSQVQSASILLENLIKKLDPLVLMKYPDEENLIKAKEDINIGGHYEDSRHDELS